ARNDLRDVFLRDLLAEHRAALLKRGEPGVLRRELAFELGEPPVAELRRLLEVPLPLRFGRVLLDLLDRLLGLPDLLDHLLLGRPLRAQAARLFPLLCELALDLLQPFLRLFRFLLLESALLDLD